MKTPFQLVGEFHETFGHPVRKEPVESLAANEAALRVRLLLEEVREVVQEIYGDDNDVVDDLLSAAEALERFQRHGLGGKDIDPAKVGKELADLEYVTVGFSHVLGLPHDQIFEEVHRSNMSKAGPDGRPIYDAGGKILKGPNYSPADIEAVLLKESGWQK